jgi:hypothetical protein
MLLTHVKDCLLNHNTKMVYQLRELERSVNNLAGTHNKCNILTETVRRE